jgi:alpha-tubulin suppressor-like RCC1 family protein
MMVTRSVGIKQVAADDYHTVALKNDGTVVVWGATIIAFQQSLRLPTVSVEEPIKAYLFAVVMFLGPTT